MKLELHEYDIYPKVFPVDRPVRVTIRPLGKHAAFSGPCRITVQRMDRSMFTSADAQPDRYWDYPEQTVEPDGTGCLVFSFTPRGEAEHYIRVWKGEKRVVQLSVYALEPDLAGRTPFRGDLHVHTFRSDGRSDPGTTCAYYRKLGYDFMAITDHERYYPSLEAIRDYAGVDSALTILPGEEVHLPHTNVHLINAGGTYSVNGLFKDGLEYVPGQPFSTGNSRDTGCSLAGRAMDDTVTPPDMITPEQYNRELDEIEAELTDYPRHASRRSYAVCVWALRKIHEAGGLAVFAHPFWISNLWQINELLTRYMMEKHPFDAFEVLGGENYYQQNGIQSALYYDEYRRGRVHPIVGSTDSHCPYDTNRNYNICTTIVFADENRRESLVQAIREGRSVAVDTISKEYRLVGEYRYQKYAAFLMEHFYPLHDRQAAMDGEVLRQYYVGEATAEEAGAMARKAKAQFDKYFVR